MIDNFDPVQFTLECIAKNYFEDGSENKKDLSKVKSIEDLMGVDLILSPEGLKHFYTMLVDLANETRRAEKFKQYNLQIEETVAMVAYSLKQISTSSRDIFVVLYSFNNDYREYVDNLELKVNTEATAEKDSDKKDTFH